VSIYSKFVKHISSPMIYRRDGLKGFFVFLKELEQTQYWSRDQIIDYQIQKLKTLLVHAFMNTDYYRKLFNEADFDPVRFKELNDLRKIPTLSKNEIRDNLRSLRANNYRSTGIHEAETGGTTGVKMKFFRDNDCLSPKEAALFRFDKWTGWDFGERMGIVWTAQQDYVGHWTLKAKIKNALSLRQVVFPAAIMDEESISNYVKQLMVKKPTMIKAFASPIYEVAKYIRDNKIENIKLKGVITTGEPLYKHQRKAISGAFHCEVFDSYRTREAGPVAQECELHNGMHINAESLYVESVAPQDPGIVEGDLKEIVITDLLNYGMPLIRYKMGDLGVLANEVCPCGRGLPLIKRMEGRVLNTLYTPDKRRITAGSLVLYLVDEAPGLLGQVQIVQDENDHLTIRLTKEPPPTEEIRNYQIRTVRRLFGDDMKVSFEEVDRINRDPSGKYLFTICNVKT